MDYNKIWGGFTNAIRASFNEVSYKTWIAPLYIHRIDEEAGIIYLASKEDFVINFVNSNHIPLFEKVFKSLLNKDYRVVVKFEKDYEPSKIDTTKYRNAGTQEKLFDPHFTFENFVVGNSNKYAHAASLAVAETPAAAYNPLFIYGGSGLGKTHLMQAIGVHIIRNNPKAKVLYVSSEAFTNEFITAIKDTKIKSFQNKYRNLDVLLIDDIQFLQGKESTQEEFFYTFNALHQNNKQIVITSDCPPNNLRNLDDRLRTRFSWNMIADIQPPDYETRVAILKNLVDKSDMVMDDDLYDVLCLIAEQVKDNVRELEGAYTRVVAFSNLLGEKITVDYAKNVLKDIIKDNEQAVAPERIRSIVANHYHIKISDMDSPKRNAEITLPRQVAMYLCRTTTDISLPKIGKLFGNRHYSTVIHAVEKIENDLKYDEELYENIEAIKAKINSKIK